jgi:hypothetical protein
MPDAIAPQRLSKSRYTTGLQCAKLLWWKVHEPDSSELVPPPGQQIIFDRGHATGELARTYVPGGVLIDLPYYDVEGRVAATAAALASGAPVIYEASFFTDDVFVAVDILQRTEGPHSYALIEVKSTLHVKRRHLDDVAIQLHVARRAGLSVERAELMHLNADCRHPDLTTLFVREDVTAQLEPALAAAPGKIQALLAAIHGPLPDVAPGVHCTKPYDCPFMARCWPAVPNGIGTLYHTGTRRKAELLNSGIRTLADLPVDYPATTPAARQIASARRGEMIVEPGLRASLEELQQPIAFLDFETIDPVVPVWPGCAPCQKIPVQFSCHRQTPDGLVHTAHLADGPGDPPGDPREPLARALIDACAGAPTVLAYNDVFERGCLRGLIAALPHLAAELTDVLGRLRDLLPIVRDHVYHPDFQGSFSIKDVLPALVPGSGYDGLAIHEGDVASSRLEALLLDDRMGDEERTKLRSDLLRYCEMDTLAMVRLWERLGELARASH